LQAGQCLRVSCNLLRQKLESDETVEPSVFGFVNDTHPPAAQPFDDAIVRDGSTDHFLWIVLLDVTT
jgi:hypothetical protein